MYRIICGTKRLAGITRSKLLLFVIPLLDTNLLQIFWSKILEFVGLDMTSDNALDSKYPESRVVEFNNLENF